MVEGIHTLPTRELKASVERRQTHWKRDRTSKEAYDASVAANRERFRTIIGAVGERVAPVELSYVSGPDSPAKLAENDDVTIYAVRWSVYPGVDAEGLLLEPKDEIRANVIALGDCDWTPEQFTGLARGVDARFLAPYLQAERGYRVLVPTLIDRTAEFSGSPLVRMTNLPHREWIYRMAFETGRHIIGYEVDKVRAAVDWFTRPGEPKRPIEVIGYGEGGLIAFYAAAVDTRIDAATIRLAYFGPRGGVWQEPIYRNVWALLEEFGDAEIGSLIAPRRLVIETSAGPEVAGPPAPARGGRNTAAPGVLTTTGPTDIKAEHDRMRALWPGRENLPFLLNTPLTPLPILTDARPRFDTRARMKRQVDQLVNYTQGVIRTSELRRYAYWAKADTSSPEKWAETTEPYRTVFHEELIGKFPAATEPLVVKTRQVFDEPKWTGYAVQIPVWPDVVASGILLWPKDLKEGERRPVVVCQHGLEGRPNDVANPTVSSRSLPHAYAAQLADRGYIVYAPRTPTRAATASAYNSTQLNPLKSTSLFSVIVRQHERTARVAGEPVARSIPSGSRFTWPLVRGKQNGDARAGRSLEKATVSLHIVESALGRPSTSGSSRMPSIDRSYHGYMYTHEWGNALEFALAEAVQRYAEMAGPTSRSPAVHGGARP